MVGTGTSVATARMVLVGIAPRLMNATRNRNSPSGGAARTGTTHCPRQHLMLRTDNVETHLVGAILLIDSSAAAAPAQTMPRAAA